ncbi:sulfite oxidase-like oxidoreductase [Sphingomonas glacialis]|uniref:Sulfite oxidase-like oxidoreductase n=1 Tax=Sphingomonas glacialis TaxID=658225 RepID=A0A502FRF2_9SPHN|nr:sulfite oxidase-like oxidoreductase [Sphingomonas glacialis]TPG52098.1 sulfite oxidase-like oxidoreductase [Sphingomonas glacialis]
MTTPDGDEPNKLTKSKLRWADEGKFLTGGSRKPTGERLPPGQHLVRDWPVLDLGLQPDIAREKWTLEITGSVERPAILDWRSFGALPQSGKRSDIHCVTTWSRYDNDWNGVATRDLLDHVQPTADAAAVLLHGYDKYTTNLTLHDFASPDGLLAHSWSGQPLSRDHGGPVRLVIPHLYFWKSAKWLRAIQFLTAEELGFWELNGYHRRGDPWAEERYS